MNLIDSSEISSIIVLQAYPLFAKRTFQLLLQPKIDALWMELVRADQGFHHLATLQVFQAYSAWIFAIRIFVFVRGRLGRYVTTLSVFGTLLLFFIFEARNRVDNIFDFFRRLQWLTVLIYLSWILFSVVVLMVFSVPKLLLLKVATLEILLSILSSQIIEVKLLILAIGRVVVTLLLPLLTWLSVESSVKVHL